jgi:hypothetical protein
MLFSVVLFYFLFERVVALAAFSMVFISDFEMVNVCVLKAVGTL